MEQFQVGIHGIGVALPAHIRKNAEWPPSFAEEIRGKTRSDLTLVDVSKETALLVKEVLGKYSTDPFRGSVERRVIASEEDGSDLETRAAVQALAVAEANPSDIDLLIVSSAVPDLLGSGNASAVHRKLGLPKTCLTLNHDNQCSSAVSSIITAQVMLASGAYRKALIVQSAVFSRVLPYELPLSVNFGDGATAAVLGPVSGHRGLLGSSWFNDGSYHRAVCTAPRGGGRWQDAKGGLVTASLEPEKGREAIFRFGDMAKEAVDAAAEKANIDLKDVKFFACHQPTAWFVELCQRSAMLQHAAAPSTFSQTAGLGPCNVMLNLNEGLMTGALRRDDLVAVYSMGSGFTWGAAILRWGR